MNLGRVPGENDVAPLVDQADEGNASYSKVLDKRVLVLPAQQREVQHPVPLPAGHSLPHHLFAVVHAEADDPDLVAPGALVLLEHFLVVLHGFLAGPTPGGPHVHQQHLPYAVRQLGLTLVPHIVHQPEILELASRLHHSVQLSIDALLFQCLIDCVKFVFVGVLEGGLESLVLRTGLHGLPGPLLDGPCSDGLDYCALMGLEISENSVGLLQHSKVLYLTIRFS